MAAKDGEVGEFHWGSLDPNFPKSLFDAANVQHLILQENICRKKLH